eukprot:749481-Hanusia_phi.AAC.22
MEGFTSDNNNRSMMRQGRSRAMIKMYEEQEQEQEQEDKPQLSILRLLLLPPCRRQSGRCLKVMIRYTTLRNVIQVLAPGSSE